MKLDKSEFSTALDNWPPGGGDSALATLQRRYLQNLELYNIPGLLTDPLLRGLAIVSSFGAESAVLLHYVSCIRPGIAVIFLDTGMHFPETRAYRAVLAERLNIEVRDIRPHPKSIAEHDPRGRMNKHDPDACCRMRKTIPLQDALVDFDGWITGRKRFQGPTRATLPVLERDGRHIKINPLALWSPRDLNEYAKAHDLPPHPLLAHGFRSVGCAPCTRAVDSGEDPRAGRWPQMLDKVECGIHFGPDGKLIRRKRGDNTA